MGVMIQTAILVTVILAVRKLSGEKLHVYIRYALWLAVVLRLLIPVNFIYSPFSALHAVNAVMGQYGETAYGGMQLTDRPEAHGLDDTALMEQPGHGSSDYHFFEIQPGEGSAGDGVSNSQMPQKDGTAMSGEWTGETVVGILRVIRAVGSLVVGGFLIFTYIGFRRRLYRMRRCCQEEGIRMDVENPHQLYCGSRNNGRSVGWKTVIPVYWVDGLESPCLAGVIHPAIYISSETGPDSDYFRYAVTHEQVHYFHGDHIWALLRAVLVIVYWFHPFVCIAAAVSARDGEIACDYGTIRRLG